MLPLKGRDILAIKRSLPIVLASSASAKAVQGPVPSMEPAELQNIIGLGTPVCTNIDEFLEKFQRGGRGSFPIQKISLQNF